MLTILVDGFSIFIKYIVPLSLFVAAILGYGLLLKSHLAVHGERFHTVLFVVGGGIIVLVVLTFFLFAVSYYFEPFLLYGGFATLLPAVYFVIYKIRHDGLKKVFTPHSFALGLALFLLLLVRLAFLKYSLLPPYSDSPIHYQIITGLLQPQKISNYNLSLPNILSNYYHFGFHVMTAWLTLITGNSIGAMILFVGQMFLVIAPVSVMLFTYSVTWNFSGAIYAGLLAAIGWSMPAFAINWGKFPALAALAVAPAIAALVFTINSNALKGSAKTFWILVLLAGAILLHTRILICFALAGVAYWFASRITIENKPDYFRSIRFSVLYLISLVPFASLLINFYSAVIPLILFALALPFAFQKYPRMFIGVFLYTFLTWLTMWAPAFILDPSKALLDKQFVEMMLYIPFSVLTGAGFAGLTANLKSQQILKTTTYIGLVGAVIVQFLLNHAVTPDSCCDYFRRDDQRVFSWIMENTPQDSLFLISTFKDQGKVVGTDAGIWIYLLTGRPTNNMPFDVDWTAPEEMKITCNSQAKNIFIYSGGRDSSFPRARLKDNDLFHRVFQSGVAAIYQVISCPVK